MTNDAARDRSQGAAFPVVTVVTPSFNQGAFIEETIKSVLTQAGDFVLDYLIIDGGSTDQTLEIVRRYDRLIASKELPLACRGTRFRWVSEKDRGQSDAIVKGMSRAEGTILAWLNSDDLFEDGAVGRAVAAFRDHPSAAVVYGGSVYIDETGQTVGRYPAEPFDRKRLAVANFISQPSAFFSRAAYEKCGGVDVAFRYTMDYDLWIRLTQHGSFVYLPEDLSRFRLHDASKTVFPRYALENHRECLATVRRYYGWAPLNRVAAYAYQVVRNALPASCTHSLAVTVLLSLPVAAAHYLWYNKRIRIDDLKMLTPANIRKLRNMERLWV
ncbi:MAG: glycosyltransferase family 2 protein [Nitrospiraceae bacterium]|nr:glycosyltransferase family 2 protein [Nitrospiraceae bacterium]